MPKKLTQANYEAIRDHIIERVLRTGEQIKNDFPNVLRTAIEEEAWKHFVRADGTAFKNVVEWLHYVFPNGAMMGMGKHAITYDDALQLCLVAPDVHRVLAENAPKSKPGPKPKNGNELKTPTTLIMARGVRSTSSTVLSARLAQEYPKYYEGYMRGVYKSVTAAAIAAGLLRNDVNVRRTKSGYRKMTTKERKEFWEWAKTV